MAKPDITIIGPGNVGTAFLRAVSDNGYKVRSVFSRKSAAHLKTQFPEIFFGEGLPDKNNIGEMVFIAVSDDAISDVARRISKSDESLSGKKFVHFSGAFSSEILFPLKEKGAATASFHPIKSITAETKDLSNIWFDMDGDEELLNELEILAEDLGSETLRINPEHKTLLHASAVFASNYLVVLTKMMTELTEEAGIPEKDALQAFLPLINGTVSNLEQLGVENSLTGPILRGDVETIKQHLESLKKFPELHSVYKKLGLQAVEIAIGKKGETEAYQQIKKLLS